MTLPTECSAQLGIQGFWSARVGSVAHALSLARQLGNVTHDPRHPCDFRRISPQPLESATPNTLSSRYGTGAFPFHTDAAHWATPPAYVLLYCDSPGRGRRRTLVHDAWVWPLSAEERCAVLEGVWRVAYRRPFLATAGVRASDSLHLRFDPGCMRPYGRRADAALDAIIYNLNRGRIMDFEWQSGKLLVIDNRRCLHARSDAVEADGDRVMCRILVGGCP